MLNDVSMWKSKTTVFEIGGGANPDYKMMRKRRHKYDGDNGDESSEVSIGKCNVKMMLVIDEQDNVINEDGNDTFLKVNKDVLNELENEWNANEELDVNNKQAGLIW
eukprot:510398_1